MYLPVEPSIMGLVTSMLLPFQGRISPFKKNLFPSTNGIGTLSGPRVETLACSTHWRNNWDSSTIGNLWGMSLRPSRRDTDWDLGNGMTRFDESEEQIMNPKGLQHRPAPQSLLQAGRLVALCTALMSSRKVRP